MSSQFSRVKEIPGSVWLLSTLLVILVFYVGIRTGGFNMNLERIPWGILVPCAAAFAFGHSYLLLGWQRAVTLFLMATIISFCFEYVGESTGAIFGPYEYTGVLGWKLFDRIPFLIPLAWYMMFYPSYIIANLLGEGGPIPHRTKLVPIVWLSILSAMVMTAWDLTMDPVMSYHPCYPGTLDCFPEALDQAEVGHPAWIWGVDGTHFGVPLENFRGWLITSFVVFFLYRLVEIRLPLVTAPGMNSRFLLSLPVGVYAGMAMVDTWLGYPEIEDVHLISPFVMGIPAFFAAFQLFANRTDLPLWPSKKHSVSERQIEGTGPFKELMSSEQGDAS
ncbi:carotenoid biosynthesis protein [Altererythrobacter sp.]|uniref:carotenoid biosynthesis protein n=1 Tax=Altererythrobacter sp. TaxID=1872480 RepID=UPI001B179F5D|nr:carotenoid biosynthesis protein [Altererythrobacter sp.]MBO6944272.1 carotenoid biosynthesis protein [Altererythrobacter sp.]